MACKGEYFTSLEVLSCYCS